MKHMKRFAWFILAFMSLVIVSCNEDDEHPTPPEKNKTEMTHDREDSSNNQQDDAQPEDKEEQKATTRTIMYSDVIRDREELSEQIRSLMQMKKMAESYGYDILATRRCKDGRT